jgi:Uma2 family endonuclease
MLKQPLAADSEPVPYRFSVEDWHRLGEAGIFDKGDRVELLDGEIIIMSPIGDRHAWACTLLGELFVEQGRRRYVTWQNLPVEADPHSEPQPDLALLPRHLREARRLPLSQETHLVVEVADSSLRHDRLRKLRKYAVSGVPEYWIVNLVDDQIEVFRQPKGDDYAEKLVFTSGQKVGPLAFSDVVIEVAEVIPAR